ncbi:MAG: domain containing protein [Pseudonocardia sp.]|jgi:CBS domain containing-hemolysin-like protein|uniref:hemolysin family protein n=1 Tax=Pseudonocardia sp. TaxID=60912 RepID=UPI0026016A77|nr:hemolysin family protein [Pseudonocardia sp.]MCU1628563.1 domain containing protein [Pseudonocardia sp.]MDT7703223.1 magnesium and cobalt exporter, family [Pseudonocardiales bacterium]HEV7471152.1 hemolysin family protein [Pseudonocardia sp.]
MNAVGFLVIAIVLVPLAGLFAAADAALTFVSRARVDALVRSGKAGARALSKVVADRPRHVNLLLLLRLMAETAATVLLAVALASWITPPGLGVLLAAVIMVVVSYVLIGVGPRTVGRQHPYAVGLVVAVPVRMLATVLSPLASLLILVGNAITPGPGFREGPFSSEVELRELVDMASTRGVVDEDERQMIHSVFELGDTIVRDVMVPRPDLVWAERDIPVEKVVRLALKSGYSRIPVLGEGIDDIIGVAYLKDLVRASYERPDAPLPEVVRPAFFVPDSKRIDELLREMQRTRIHMAIVVDEYGGTAGVVTIEDILEEIVGEITDEYDRDEVPDVEHLDGRTLRLAARLPVEDLEELFQDEFAGTDREAALAEALEDADVDTVGGLLAQRLGRVPLPGAETEVEGLLHLRGEGGKDARGRIRITTVLVTPLDPPDENDEDEDEDRSENDRTDDEDGGARTTEALQREESDVRQ